MPSYADPDAVLARARQAWRPPPRIRVSDWADRHFVLSHESAAVPGPWHTLPYQREILDSIGDPEVEQVTWMKSARVGYTLCMSVAIGYFIAPDPSPMLVVQPTVPDAEGYSKETIAPMLRDVPALSEVMFRDDEDRGPRDSSQTIRHKSFPGGVLSLIGANSGAGFRRISRRVVFFDEVDAYPPSAGNEGDPVSLGIKRTEAFWNRKIIAGSTPLIAGASRIEEMFLAGDQRRYHVPCPHCGHMDFLTFRARQDGRGHVMRWEPDDPEGAHFVCSANGEVIEHHHKRWMVERGEWRADKPGGRHRSYHLWSAYSYSANATWGQIATEFLQAQREGPDKLKTFINTTLGETWQERGEAPDWERLYERREQYPIGTVPEGVLVLTAGVDVQKDRFVYQVVGWTPTKESFVVDAGEFHGDTSSEDTWEQLEELLGRSFPGADREHSIAMMAVDSGYNTQQVYGWCRRKPMSRVIACKGVKTERALVGTASPVDVTTRGKRIPRGYKVWPVGVDVAKTELYGWLRLRIAEGKAPPPGYCHFPELGEEFFRQLTAERLVAVRTKKGYTVLEWHLVPNRQNHQLDARVLARVAASVLGLDRRAPPLATNAPTPRPTLNAPAPAAEPPSRPSPRRGWLGGGGAMRRGSWLGRRT